METVVISDLCRHLLEENRQALNARFQKRKAQGAKIDADMWLLHVQRRILPLVDRVGDYAKQNEANFGNADIQSRCFQVLNQMYEVSLDLFSAGHFTETTGILPEALAQLWDQTLCKIPHLLMKNPKLIAGGLSNGVLSIAKSQSGSVQTWLASLERVAAEVDSADHLMQAGKVAAWTAGLPEFRNSALEIARQLPVAIVRSLLRLSEDLSDENVQQTLVEWQNNPWHSVKDGLEQAGIVQVARCGAFQGFGGVFLYPPKVFQHDHSIFASDGKSVWLLKADSFGQSFHRCDIANESSRRAAKGSPSIDKNGVVTWKKDFAAMPELSGATSQACDDHTLAVTIPTSFHVFLITNTSTQSSWS